LLAFQTLMTRLLLRIIHIWLEAPEAT
jgi:hypothetical protein